MKRITRRTAVLFALALVPVGAGSVHADAAFDECDALPFKQNSTYTAHLSVVVRGPTCEEGVTVAVEWQSALKRSELPGSALNSVPFYIGGPFRFGGPWRIDDYTCRWRRQGSAIGEVWCKASDGRVIGWASDRDVVLPGEEAPARRPFYPAQGLEDLRPRLPKLSSRDAVADFSFHLQQRFGAQFDEALQGPSIRCSRTGMRSFRCTFTWRQDLQSETGVSR